MTPGFDPCATALRLAAETPTARFACPVCAALVLGRNLAGHLDATHGGREAQGSCWIGADHAITRPLTGLVGIAVVLAAAGIAAFPLSYRLVLGALACVLAASLGLAALSASGRLRASLAWADGVLVLRYAFGLLERRIRIAGSSVQAGRRVAFRAQVPTASAEDNAPGTHVLAGTYLRIANAAAHVVIGTRRGSVRGAWSHPMTRRGPDRQTVDIVLEPEARVAVEYLLAAESSLTGRNECPERDLDSLGGRQAAPVPDATAPFDQTPMP